MMKKSGAVAALTAALLAMAVLVTTGCLVPDTEKEGNVRIIIGEYSDAKTIMPETPTFGGGYDIAFVDSTLTPLAVNHIAGSTITSISMAPGVYTLTVTGYASYTNATTNVPVARATTTAGGGITTDQAGDTGGTSVTITTGTTIIAVALSPIITGAGTLSWNITPTGFTPSAGTIFISNYSDRSSVGSESLLTPSGSLPSLPSGDYWVNFTIGNIASGTFTHSGEVVRIYQGMTSPFVFPVSADFLYLAPGNGSATGSITYINHPIDTGFTIAATSIPAQDGDCDGSLDNPIVLSRSGTPNSVAIQLVNASDFTGGYKWYIDAVHQASADDGDLTVSTANAPFNTLGKRQITLEALIGAIPYTMSVFVEIE
jgi:hypothetical protein